MASFENVCIEIVLIYVFFRLKIQKVLKKINKVHMVLETPCMDLEPCLKVPNLVVIPLEKTKLDQMTNILKWSFIWWCYFIKLIKFASRPSPLLNLKVANSATEGYLY